MTAMEKSDYEKVSFGRVPFIWKKKINNLVKESPDHAIRIFFDNFRENNEAKQMIYGFEQLLPQSLAYILNHLDELNPDRFIHLLSVFTNLTFLDSILALEMGVQKKFLNKIIENWGMCDVSITKGILGQFNPKLSEEVYRTAVKTKNMDLIELLILWVKCDVRVLYRILQSYLQQPTDLILPLFREVSKDNLINACSSENLPNKLSPQKITIFLKIFDSSREELTFLTQRFSNASNKAQQQFIEWLLSKNLTNSTILDAVSLKQQAQTNSLIISYFSQITRHETEKEISFLSDTLESLLFTITSSILKYLDEQKDSHGIDYLFSLLTLLEKDLNKYAQFFTSEFQNYSTLDKERVIDSYFQTKDINIQNILRSSLNSLKTTQWKKLIEQIIQQQYYTKRNRVSRLLESFDAKTIGNISNYLIKNKYISHIGYLYQNFNYFLPLLTTSQPIESTVYTRLASYLKIHFKDHFEEIIQISSKISFPMSIIASELSKTDIEKLVSRVGFEKALITSWEKVFLLRPDEVLPLFLNKFEEISKKNSETLLTITKKLIDIEIVTFWQNFSSISSKSLPKYKILIKHAFNKSIPILGEIIMSLPRKHSSYIRKYIIPDFSTKSNQMLYAILSIRDPALLDHKNIEPLILSILDLNPKKLLYLVLIRLTKLNIDVNLKPFVENLFNQIIGKYPRVTIENIDDHNLSSFAISVGNYTNKLSEKKFGILLKYIIPGLKTKCLRPVLVDQCLSRLRGPTNDYKLIREIITNDQTKKFSAEGQALLSALIKQAVGRSIEDDIRILTILNNSHLSVRESLLSAYFTKLPQNSLDYVLSDPSINISENSTIRALTTRFAKRPPSEPEKYYISLYQQSQRAEIKRAILPLIGEYCSWINLPFLMELPEQGEFEQEYSLAIKKFIKRFEIDSPQTIFHMWSSGLKEIYKKTLKTTTELPKQSSYQSNCPKCNNPVLEKQKNCGFCTQRLTCAICLKSVVTTTDVDLVECKQCSSFFHRRHLLQSVKIRNECPICAVRLTERGVISLPQVQFRFH